jgi:hypothetical protein
MLFDKYDRVFLFEQNADAGGGGEGGEGDAPAEGGSDFEVVDTTVVETDEGGEGDPPDAGASDTQPNAGEAGTGTGEPPVDWQARLAAQEEAHRASMAQHARQVQEMQGQIRQQELAGLDATQRAAKLQQWRNEDLQKREEALQRQQYASKLAGYYSNYVPVEAFQQARTPAEAQHLVLNYQHNRIKQLEGQVAALTKSVKQRPVEPVGQGGAAPTNPNRVNIADLTPDEIAAINERLKTGAESFEDIFGVGS